jgi:hypothetical protein
MVRADKALHEAKSQRKNRIFIHGYPTGAWDAQFAPERRRRADPLCELAAGPMPQIMKSWLVKCESSPCAGSR